MRRFSSSSSSGDDAVDFSSGSPPSASTTLDFFAGSGCALCCCVCVMTIKGSGAHDVDLFHDPFFQSTVLCSEDKCPSRVTVRSANRCVQQKVREAPTYSGSGNDEGKGSRRRCCTDGQRWCSKDQGIFFFHFYCGDVLLYFFHQGIFFSIAETITVTFFVDRRFFIGSLATIFDDGDARAVPRCWCAVALTIARLSRRCCAVAGKAMLALSRGAVATMRNDRFSIFFFFSSSRRMCCAHEQDRRR